MLDGTAGMRLGRSLCDQIRSVIPPYLTFFDDAPSVLCHGDLDGSNIIIHNDGLLGFLDWEFAYSGPPFGDLGQLLRIGADWSSLAAGYFGEGETPSGGKEALFGLRISAIFFTI
jgi:Ser/Thr protein kinase RdoA (MazF antagonist)